MTHVLGRVFLAAILVMIAKQQSSSSAPLYFSGELIGTVHAATSTTSTKKIKDAQLGEVIQIGSSKFVKIGTNRWMAVASAQTCDDGLNVGASKNFAYTGSVQTCTVCAGRTYRLEVWGAQGGNITSYNGGRGGYSVGQLTPPQEAVLYIYVGGQGLMTSYSSYQMGGGGGASDFSIFGTAGDTTWDEQRHFYSRLLVAGGGSGAGGWYGYNNGAYGGGSSGADGAISSNRGVNQYGGGASQIAGGGTYGSNPTYGAAGTFGKAMSSTNYSSMNTTYGGKATAGWNGGAHADGYDSSGGGGGWYGGGTPPVGNYGGTGGGGSGWVYTQVSYDYWAANSTEGQSGKWLLDSSWQLTSATMYAGNQSFAAPGGGSETGHAGNGYARITRLN